MSHPILHLLLAESALELVPEDLWAHPSVAKQAKTRGKRPGETLLDDTFHHAAMGQAARKGRFEDLERRGRPDIIHTALLVALESRLAKEGSLRVWVHTRDDRLLRFRHDVRIQRAQHRFYGLMERLLVDGVVPQGAKGEHVLIEMEKDVPIAEAVQRMDVEQVVVFDEGGEDRPLDAVFGSVEGDVAAVVGGFPTGRFRSELSFADQTVALGKEPLAAWTVAGEAVVAFRSRA